MGRSSFFSHDGLRPDCWPRALPTNGEWNWASKSVIRSQIHSQNDRTIRNCTDLTYVVLGYFPDWIVARMGVMEFLASGLGDSALQNDQTYLRGIQHVDAGPRHLRCYHLTADGAGFAVDREDMITSTDNWFRPCDVCVGPDGAVFVADWYDTGVGGHGMGDTTRGRIFRVAPKGNKPVVPKVELDTKEGLHAALASPSFPKAVGPCCSTRSPSTRTCRSACWAASPKSPSAS
jgi:hypothetical protein